MHRQFQRIRTFHFWASQNRCSSCYHNYCWGHCLGGCCFDLLLLQLLLKPLKVAPPPKRLLPSAATTIATANAEASAPTVATSTSVAAVTAASNTTANTASAGTDYCCSECCCTLFHPLGTVSTAAASSFLLPQPQLQLLLLLRPSFAVAATIAATATKYWQLWMICLHPLLVFFAHFAINEKSSKWNTPIYQVQLENQEQRYLCIFFPFFNFVLVLLMQTFSKSAPERPVLETLPGPSCRGDSSFTM